MIPFSYRNIFEVMINSITNFLIIFFIFLQLKSQISQIYQNGVNPFCDKTLHIILTDLMLLYIEIMAALL